MRLLWVDMENFLAFGKARVALDRQGLVAVLGQNRDAAAADSNGAAKSSVLEALVWCFFGKTMRGLTGDEVMHRRVKQDCRVVIHLEDDNGAEWEVARTRGMALKRANDLQLLCNGAVPPSQAGINVDVQDQVHTLIGMDKETFVQSVLMSYGTKPYSELSDGEQKEVLEAILHVDQYAKARDVVNARYKKRQLELATVNTEIVALEQSSRSIQTRLHKLQQSQNEHSTLLQQRRMELMRRKAECQIKIEEQYHSTGLDALLDAEQDMDAKVQGYRQQEDDINRKIMATQRMAAAKKQEAYAQRAQLQARRQQYDGECTTFNALVGKPCPTCKREVFHNEVEELLGVWDGEIKKLDYQIDVVINAYNDIEAVEHKMTQEFQANRSLLRNEMRNLEAQQQEIRARIQQRAASLQLIVQLEQQSFNLGEEIEKLETDNNPYAHLVVEAAEELEKALGQLRRLAMKQKALDLEIRHLLFWDHGFGNQGIKHHVIQGVLPFLDERAQHYVDLMSGGDMTIHFESGFMQKNKKWTDEFRVVVENAQGAEVYKGNSDGEKGRVNLCIGWALGDLAAQRAKKSIRFKALDEPFEHLDETGEDLVMKFLHTVVSDCETILCITHSDHLRNQFPKVLTVVKEGGFSRVEE